ncbi:MAG: hypothetical protein PHY12_04155 [Eubacteriales bacterium]|nr:hypothetical protein [Eubacteriales bacterium]
MDEQAYIELGLNGGAPLKLILCGEVQTAERAKVGVVSVAYATCDRERAKERLAALSAQNPQNYYMVYSVPLDTDLTALSHYPSIEITEDDLR